MSGAPGGGAPPPRLRPSSLPARPSADGLVSAYPEDPLGSWTALPQIAQLSERDNLCRVRAGTDRKPYLQATESCSGTWRPFTDHQHRINAAGADVSSAPMVANRARVTLGRTTSRPQHSRSLLEWKIEKAGYVPVEDVGLLPRYITLLRLRPDVPHGYVLDTPEARPRGMLRASPRGLQLLAIAGLEHVAPFELEDFWIDRYEVTNRDSRRLSTPALRYQRTGNTVREGCSIVAWNAAMSVFRDPQGAAAGHVGVGIYQRGRTSFRLAGSAGTRRPPTRNSPASNCRRSFTEVAADRRATSGVLLAAGVSTATDRCASDSRKR